MRLLIRLKSYYGTYKSFIKVFNDEEHFNNWYDYVSNRGNKIIGVELKKTKNR